MEKKQTSIDWLYNTIDYEIVSYLDGEIDLNELSIAMLKIKEQTKAMHQQEIEEAYDRKVIGDIQNWYIRNGKHYYELHYNKNTQDREIG